MNFVEAKSAKMDEFYTQYSDIQKEVNAYLEYNPDTFKNKTLLLPCDDPEWSNFTKFFAQNFETLGLKKLISTSYARDSKKRKYGFDDYADGYHQMSLFELQSPVYEEDKSKYLGRIFTLTRDINNTGTIDIDDLEWDYLSGDGDFRSDEVKKLRDEADIIVTNPPFSMYTEFIDWVFEQDKKFLIIGNKNSVAYKDVFSLIVQNKMWSGSRSWSGGMWFVTPNEKDYDKVEDGIYYKNVPSAWFTNLDHGRRHEPLRLMTMEDNIRYSKHKEIREEKYPHYDNYDAIEIPYVDAIPSDYDGLMGVPVSFLDKYNADQFEIVASSQTGCHPDSMVIRDYKDYLGYHQNGTLTGRTGSTCGNNPMLLQNDGKHDYYMNDNGRIVQSASNRIFIKKK